MTELGQFLMAFGVGFVVCAMFLGIAVAVVSEVRKTLEKKAPKTYYLCEHCGRPVEHNKNTKKKKLEVV